LVHERALALSHAIDPSTLRCYGSGVNSYLSFVRIHNFPIDPTPDTLSFFVVFMCHHISPRSVSTYLSGIVQQLEPYFPNVRHARNSRLVQRTLKGCSKLKAQPVQRKTPFSTEDLTHLLLCYCSSDTHDDLLFLSIFLTGFFGLLRLGELVFPSDKAIRDWRKITRRSSVLVTSRHYEFTLPAHKADRYFDGCRVIIWGEQFGFSTRRRFLQYLSSRDKNFPLASPLWLTAAGTVPDRAFFMSRMKLLFTGNYGGHSLRAGGATLLAERGVAPHIIQATGRWSSDAFQLYIRKHPVLLQGMLFGRRPDEPLSGPPHIGPFS
jgi:hypothetical protein